MSGLEAMYAAGFILGAGAVLGIGWRSEIRTGRMAFVVAGLGMLAVILLAATYKDEYCGENAACRLLGEPSYFVLRSVLPGMVLGLIATGVARFNRANSPPRRVSDR
jgi:hypothetical protein